MQTSVSVRTAEIVTRSARNYPTVLKDISKELKDQMVGTGKALFNLLSLFGKVIGIATFPLWILPLALAMYVTFRVCEAHPVPQIQKGDY